MADTVDMGGEDGLKVRPVGEEWPDVIDFEDGSRMVKRSDGYWHLVRYKDLSVEIVKTKP